MRKQMKKNSKLSKTVKSKKVFKKSPRNVNKFDDLYKLPNEGYNPAPYSENWGILVNDIEVTLFRPVDGTAGITSDFITIPKKQFNALVDFYNRPQTLRK
jgi:hypothetical protein